MTIGNRIEQSRLLATANDSGKRDTLLFRAFGTGQKGLTRQRLDSIRHYEGNLYEKAQYASQVLFESLVELGLPHTDITPQFTVDNLAALVNKEWHNPEDHTEILRRAMNERHAKKLEQKKRRFNFTDLSGPQLFRETISHEGVPLYFGNLYRARRVWPNFQPSNEDFLANISIPLRIGPIEALLLGIYWSDGYVRANNMHLEINGQQGDFDSKGDVYRDCVAILLKRIHNYGFVSSDNYLKGRKTRNGIAYRPKIEVNSAAVCTWLVDDLGFPMGSGTYVDRRIPLNHLSGLKVRNGFLAGLISGLGSTNEYGGLVLEHKNEAFMEDISALMAELGYSHSEVLLRERGYNNKPRKIPIWYIEVSPTDVRKLSTTHINTNLPSMGLLFNPRHYAEIPVHFAP